ncbi:hypothetical protein KUTeg_006204 [Tegillarca granosa]|uniref:Hormone-sensitive lipase n=1 Tax=Tegillarca granosa TaxID=220873 RepID=A0ABQ9FFX4_TEGGR|nr:hypothetical protein KUTeg_006204 [Tegillarca granosa]
MFSTLFRDLRSLAVNNIEYFQHGNTNYHARFHQTFSLLFEHLDRGIQPAIEEISSKLSAYDLSPDIQANGHRSLLKIVYKCCVHLLQLSRYINSSRDSFFFRRSHTCKELESYVETLGQLRACLYYAQRLIAFCDEGNLIADEDNLNNPVADKLMEEVELLRQDSFYGRCLGFQFASSIMNSGKYMMSPELRAEQQLPSLICPHVQVNEVMYLQPESFELPIEGSTDMATITPPCAHTGYGPVRVRLISFEHRDGQYQEETTNQAVTYVIKFSYTLPRYICEQWAMDLDVPILSIDYSLAPELPFPRALEECFYAYCWALKNCHKLGSTGEMICLAGDSAGGNLMTSTSLRAGSFGIRVPDGIMAAYTPFLAQYTPSPSRLMCLMDPLLPVGILARCLAGNMAFLIYYILFCYNFLSQKTYAGVGEEFTTCLSGIDLNKSRKPILPDVEEWVNIEAEESADNDSAESFTDIDQKCLNDGPLSEPFTEINQIPQNSEDQTDPSSDIDFSCVDLNGAEKQTLSTQGLGNSCIKRTEDLSKGDNHTLHSSCSNSQIKDNSLDAQFPTKIPRSPSAPVISNLSSDKEQKFSPIMAYNRPIVQSPLQIMRKLPIVKNPYMSPLLSPDDMLMTLPPVYLVVSIVAK